MKVVTSYNGTQSAVSKRNEHVITSRSFRLNTPLKRWSKFFCLFRNLLLLFHYNQCIYFPICGILRYLYNQYCIILTVIMSDTIREAGKKYAVANRFKAHCQAGKCWHFTDGTGFHKFCRLMWHFIGFIVRCWYKAYSVS